MTDLHAKGRDIRRIGSATIDLVLLFEAGRLSEATTRARALQDSAIRCRFDDIADVARRLYATLLEGREPEKALEILVQLVEAVDAASSEFDPLPPMHAESDD